MSKKDEALKLAMNKAFQLGQRYWSWADSEYSSHWKKADAAKSEFDQLVQDTIDAALAEQDDPDLQDKAPELVEQHYKQVVDGVRAAFDAKRKQPAQQQEPVAWLSRDDARLALWDAINKREFGNPTDDKLILDHLRKNGLWIGKYTSPPASKPWVGIDG